MTYASTPHCTIDLKLIYRESLFRVTWNVDQIYLVFQCYNLCVPGFFPIPNLHEILVNMLVVYVANEYVLHKLIIPV